MCWMEKKKPLLVHGTSLHSFVQFDPFFRTDEKLTFLRIEERLFSCSNSIGNDKQIHEIEEG
jgi:hypothetical protein